MTQSHARRPAPNTLSDEPLLLSNKGNQSSAAVDSRTLKAAQMLKSLHADGDVTLQQKQAQALTADEQGEALKMFALHGQMDVQAIVVALTNAVGFEGLRRAYKMVTGRSLEQDFAQQMGAFTASHAGAKATGAGSDAAGALHGRLDQGTQEGWVVGHDILDMTGQQDETMTAQYRQSTRLLAKETKTRPPAVEKALGKTQASEKNAAERQQPGAEAQQGAKFSGLSDPDALEALVSEIKQARDTGTLDDLLKSFQQYQGRDIFTFLGETVHDLGQRAEVLRHLPAPLEQPQLAFDSLLESLSLAGSASDLGTTEPQKGRGAKKKAAQSDPSAMLAENGYELAGVHPGKWGLEVRAFKPRAGSAQQDTILSFHSAAGIQLNAETTEHGEQPAFDPQVGDFSPAGSAYHQLVQNKALLEHVISQASAAGGKVVMTGHGVGGALAQLATAQNVERASRVVTFQSVNIAQQDVDRVRAFNTNATDPVWGTHYRVERDIQTAVGEAAIPGTIHYFDTDWKLRGEQDFRRSLRRPTDRAGEGHVLPMLSMFMQEVEIPREHADIKKKPRSSQATVPSVVYAGGYDTRQAPGRDPRIHAGTDPTAFEKMAETKQMNFPRVQYQEVFEKELPYNTLLAHLEKLARDARGFEDFKQKAIALMNLTENNYGQITLEVENKDLQLGDALGWSRTQRVDVAPDVMERLIRPTDLRAGQPGELLTFWNNFR